MKNPKTRRTYKTNTRDDLFNIFIFCSIIAVGVGTIVMI